MADEDEWLTSRRIDLDNPPEEAKPYVELYERLKQDYDALKKKHDELYGEYMADRTIAMNTKTVPYSIFQKTEHELRTLRDVHVQVCSERDFFRRRSAELTTERFDDREKLANAQRQLYELEADRILYKARLEEMLSKPDPGHPSGNGAPWARAENGQVWFGLLEDGSDDEPFDIDEAESMASSLWRAAREVRSQLAPKPQLPLNLEKKS